MRTDPARCAPCSGFHARGLGLCSKLDEQIDKCGKEEDIDKSVSGSYAYTSTAQVCVALRVIVVHVHGRLMPAMYAVVCTDQAGA